MSVKEMSQEDKDTGKRENVKVEGKARKGE